MIVIFILILAVISLIVFMMMKKKKGCKDTEFSENGKCVASCTEGSVYNEKKVCIQCANNEVIEDGKCVTSCSKIKLVNAKNVCTDYMKNVLTEMIKTSIRFNNFIELQDNIESTKKQPKSDELEQKIQQLNNKFQTSKSLLVNDITSIKNILKDALSSRTFVSDDANKNIKNKIDNLFETYKVSLNKIISNENSYKDTDIVSSDFGQNLKTYVDSFEKLITEKEIASGIWVTYKIYKILYDAFDRLIENDNFVNNFSILEAKDDISLYLPMDENGEFIISGVDNYLADVKNKNVFSHISKSLSPPS